MKYTGNNLKRFRRNGKISNNADYNVGIEHNGGSFRESEHELRPTICKMWFEIKHCRTGCFDFSVIPWNCIDIIFLGVSYWHLGKTESSLCSGFVRIFLFIHFKSFYAYLRSHCIPIFGRRMVSVQYILMLDY